MKLKDWVLLNLKVGALSFGSGGRQMFYYNILVNELHVLTSDEFNEIMSVTQIIPGPNLGNLVTYLGYSMFGILGAICGLLALCAPGTLLLVSIFKFLNLENKVFIEILLLIGSAIFCYLAWQFKRNILKLASQETQLSKFKNYLKSFLRFANLIIAAILTWFHYSTLLILFIGLCIGLLSEFGISNSDRQKS